ncbi:hypothetical protein ABC345_20685 [Shouchella sp. 1P09AA]|uniref:hypothetical protein n=1 Tax=unclassified Shouchella TaxID=2893065 RepID=UPI0039A35DE4
MDNYFSTLEADFTQIGFKKVRDNKFQGRVPKEGDINGNYINVSINTTHLPFKAPNIELISFIESNKLFRDIPKHWKHIDEWGKTDNPKESSFIICCLHNWIAKPEHDAKFIYQRIFSWLKNNVNNTWPVEDDLLGWRLTPQMSQSNIILTKDIFSGLTTKKVFTIKVVHSSYIHKNGKKSRKEVGTDFSLEDIDFEKTYTYIPLVNDKMLIKLKAILFGNNKIMTSNFITIKLPSSFSFTTFYQLLMSVRENFHSYLKELSNRQKIFPFLITYRGVTGNLETVSFITNKAYLKGDENFRAHPLKIETAPSRPVGIPLKVGLLGTGSLGSNLARLLTDKQTKELILHDTEKLSAENLGHHELNGYYIGDFKMIGLTQELFLRSVDTSISWVPTIDELCNRSDILIVTVGNTNEFHNLAFNELKDWDKPIIWAWVSPYNILQEIVITTPETGCLNCYFLLSHRESTLKEYNNMLQDKLANLPKYNHDMCGNPHTISEWEKTVFLSTQITSIIRFYSKSYNFNFNYYTYFWGPDDIIASPTMGHLNRDKKCTC